MLNIPPRINLSHLDHLSPQVVVDGAPILLTSIYADAPGYELIGDPDEGIACVDDVGRAVLVYLDEHARTGNAHALDQARAGLNFTLRMQEPDGRFTNFVTDRAGTINRDGATSKAGLGWWAFRGMQAFARGYREFAQTDAAFAARLLAGFRRSEDALTKVLAASGDRTVQLRGRALPAWLDQVAPDQASLAVMALAQMQETLPRESTRTALATMAQGVRAAAMNRGSDGAFAYTAEMPGTPELWHAWGAHAGEALATAGRVLSRPDLIDAARRELDGVLGWQLATGRIHELTPLPMREGQQAYGVATAVRAAVELYRATGEERHARQAGLHASWLFGNNMAGGPMYDESTGRVYDGIDGDGRGINRSSGAESTIEGLSALQAIAGIPEAQRYAGMRAAPGGAGSWSSIPASRLRDAGTDEPVPISKVAAAQSPLAPLLDVATLAPGSRTRVKIDVPVDGDYVLLSSGMRRTGGAASTVVASIDGVGAFGTLVRPAAGADGAHASLDLAAGEPVRLTRGQHELTLTASGAAGAAPAQIQGLVLHPAIASTTFVDTDGGRSTVSFDVTTGQLELRDERDARAARATPS